MGEEKQDPTIEVKTYNDLTVGQLNEWRLKLVKRYFEYDETLRLMKKDKGMVIKTERGPMPIYEILEIRWDSLREAIDIVDVLEDMRKKLEAGETVLTDEARDWTKEKPQFTDF